MNTSYIISNADVNEQIAKTVNQCLNETPGNMIIDDQNDDEDEIVCCHTSAKSSPSPLNSNDINSTSNNNQYNNNNSSSINVVSVNDNNGSYKIINARLLSLTQEDNVNHQNQQQKSFLIENQNFLYKEQRKCNQYYCQFIKCFSVYLRYNKNYIIDFVTRQNLMIFPKTVEHTVNVFNDDILNIDGDYINNDENTNNLVKNSYNNLQSSAMTATTSPKIINNDFFIEKFVLFIEQFVDDNEYLNIRLIHPYIKSSYEHCMVGETEEWERIFIPFPLYIFLLCTNLNIINLRSVIILATVLLNRILVKPNISLSNITTNATTLNSSNISSPKQSKKSSNSCKQAAKPFVANNSNYNLENEAAALEVFTAASTIRSISQYQIGVKNIYKISTVAIIIADSLMNTDKSIETKMWKDCTGIPTNMIQVMKNEFLALLQNNTEVTSKQQEATEQYLMNFEPINRKGNYIQYTEEVLEASYRICKQAQNIVRLSGSK